MMTNKFSPDSSTPTGAFAVEFAFDDRPHDWFIAEAGVYATRQEAEAHLAADPVSAGMSARISPVTIHRDAVLAPALMQALSYLHGDSDIGDDALAESIGLPRLWEMFNDWTWRDMLERVAEQSWFDVKAEARRDDSPSPEPVPGPRVFSPGERSMLLESIDDMLYTPLGCPHDVDGSDPMPDLEPDHVEPVSSAAGDLCPKHFQFPDSPMNWAAVDCPKCAVGTAQPASTRSAGSGDHVFAPQPGNGTVPEASAVGSDGSVLAPSNTEPEPAPEPEPEPDPVELRDGPARATYTAATAHNLPVGTVLLDATGVAWQKVEDAGTGLVWTQLGIGYSRRLKRFRGPYTLLHEGGDK